MELHSTKRQKKSTPKSCIFCRRSHVNCDKKRPCSRCIKRDIGYLCTADDNSQAGLEQPRDRGFEKESKTNESIIYSHHELGNKNTGKSNNGNDNGSSGNDSIKNDHNNDNSNSDKYLSTRGTNYNGDERNNNNLLLPPQPNFVSENVGSEFSSLNEFLMMLENPMPIDSEMSKQGLNEYKAVQGNTPLQMNDLNYSNDANDNGDDKEQDQPQKSGAQEGGEPNITGQNKKKRKSSVDEDDKPTSKEQFFLTAADPSTEMTPEDRLKLVINAKLEAGLLKPYDYAKGYARLQEYMDKYMSQSSKQRILKPLMSIRPAFRTIAKSLKDVDLVLVEESFERMLLSYDRVFTSMSMPACLWRRTGEIYRANKEFASLVDCTVDDLRDGKYSIYELMTEESAVNFWEKYGSIAFDKGQKAVLTSCSLRTKDGSKVRPCCFSFTIRRDRYNIPICIVGNFIPLSTTTEQRT